MSYYDECLIGCGSLSETDFLSAISAMPSKEYTALVIYTSGVACFTWEGVLAPPAEPAANDVFDIAHVLEMRLFNQDEELHARRDAMGKPFSWRRLRDNTSHADFADCALDETQLLDVDARRSHGRSYRSTTGGAYTLPVADARTIEIRNYLEYNRDGLADIVDFRIVAFGKERDE